MPHRNKFSYVWVMFSLAIVFSLALGFISFRYYQQQQKLITFFEAETKGAQGAQAIFDDIVSLYSKKHFSEIESKTKSLQDLLDQSNLILDPEFQTYYLMSGLYLWLPRVYTGNASAEDRALQRLTKNQVYDSLNKALKSDQHPIPKETSSTMMELVDKLIASDDEKSLVEISKQLMTVGSQVFIKINDERANEASKTARYSLIFAIFLWCCGVVMVIVTLRLLTQKNVSMLQVIQHQKSALEKARALATLGELSGSIGHDIANPLNVILLTTQTLEKLCDPHDTKVIENLSRVKRMVSRIEAIINSMKSFLGEGRSQVMNRVDLTKVFDDVSLLLKKKMTKHNISLDYKLDSNHMYVMGSESEYVQVFMNLVGNSIDAVKTQPQRKIEVQSELRNNKVCIRVIDTGPGVPTDAQNKIFDAFYTTKLPTEGTGLGLSITKKILTKCGGDISYNPMPSGACFEVHMPVSL